MPSPPVRKVACPSCRQSATYGAANPWRPFCSERCRSADLGAWASERFRVAAQPSAEQAEETASEARAAEGPLRKGH